MSLRTTVTVAVTCDGPTCGVTRTTDAETAIPFRARLARAGWTRRHADGGRQVDLCPVCSPDHPPAEHRGGRPRRPLPIGA